nr:enoyl-CoA hydratase/isomerase family protein [Fodinicola acaciae]
MVKTITIADLADGAAHAPVLNEDGRLVDPVMLVDIQPGASQHAQKRARAFAEGCDRLLIGVTSNVASRLTAAVDLTLSTADVGCETVAVAEPEREAHELAAAVVRNPQAALSLRQLLRGNVRLPVRTALEMESYAYSTLLGGLEFRQWLEDRGPLAPMATADEPLLVGRTDDTLYITLNRPERRNAYGREMRQALCDALRIALVDRSVNQVVVDGAGRSFCAGGDLAEFGTTPDVATAHFIRTTVSAGLLVHALGNRIEVRVHGSCVGAGVEIPSLARRVVAAADASFRLPEIAMGLIPGAGGTVGIPRRIGRWRTLHLALSGQPLPAETALRWGLVDGFADP